MKKQDFYLIGEMIHGNYGDIVNSEMLHSATNYECYKGLYSSFNSMNMFEIGYSLNRQFGPENWCLYRGKQLISFVDNHDVSRIASILTNKKHIYSAYGLLFGMPGIPCIYYGSEWGIEGRKEDGDYALRPEIDKPVFNEISEYISALSKIRQDSRALSMGSLYVLHTTNKQLIFERRYENDRVLVMINIDENEYTAYFDAKAEKGVDLISGKEVNLSQGCGLEPYAVKYVRVDV